MPDSPHLFPSSGDSTELIGEVKDVVYESADSGYAVLRIQVRGDPARHEVHAGSRVFPLLNFRCMNLRFLVPQEYGGEEH